MRRLVLLLGIALALAAQPKTERRAAGAHEHGAGKLDIAMEGLTGRLVFESPMESLTGFEHEPKSAADKKKVAGAQATVRTRMGEMVLLPAVAGCMITMLEVRVERHGKHSELHAEGSIDCRRPIAGEVSFAFGRFFSGLHKLTVQFVSDAAQTGAEILHDRGSIQVGR